MDDLWILRVGRSAEVIQAMNEGLFPIDVGIREDLSGLATREEFFSAVCAFLPDAPTAKIRSRADGLYAAFREIPEGTIILVNGKKVLSGEFCGTGTMSSGLPALRLRNVQEHATSEIPEDVQNSMRAHATLSVCRAPNAASRMRSVRKTGADDNTSLTRADEIGSRLGAYDLAHLVADLLSGDGYACRVSPPGPDGGVDIYAGKGILGVGDSLVVQVKSGKQVSTAPQVQQILGKAVECCANTSLFVSWSGFTAEARRIEVKNPFKIRLWDFSSIIKLYEGSTPDVKNKWHHVLKT